MIRVFVEEGIEKGARVQLSEAQVHYLFHVMRLKVGAGVLIFNGLDGLWDAEIVELNKKSGAVAAVKKVQEQPADAGAGADLYMALIKKENLDLVVQKATELGVRAIHPIVAARSVVHKINVERLQRIAVEASEQSERLTVPRVHEAVSLAEALAALPAGRAAVYLNERGVGVRDGLAPPPGLPPRGGGGNREGKEVAFFVGPEGGWTEAELAAFAAHKGAVSLNLGAEILRAETAAIAILAAWKFDVF